MNERPPADVGNVGKVIDVTDLTARKGRPPLLSLAVVICAYTERRWDDLRAAVQSVLHQTHSPDELVVIVDHNDQLLERAATAFGHRAATRVRVLPSAGPPGLSGARNTGVGAATAEVIAFLDDDAVAEPDWAAAMVAHYADPRVMGVGGHASPMWPDGRPGWMPGEFDWVVGCSYIGQPDTVAPVRNFIGCNMSLRRSALVEVGGFDPDIGRIGSVPLGCEETDLCIRVGRAQPGTVLLYDPAMRVRHRVSADRVRPRYFLRRCYAEGLSKAVVSTKVGAGDALQSERAYVRRVLPVGFGRALRATVTGPARAAAAGRGIALAGGLAVTAIGYGIGWARRPRGGAAAPSVVVPMRRPVPGDSEPDRVRSGRPVRSA